MQGRRAHGIAYGDFGSREGRGYLRRYHHHHLSRCDQLFKLLKNHMEPHMISYIMTYYDILWHITTYFDVVRDSMTWLYIQLHHLDLDSRRDATLRPYVLRCSEMLCDIVKCDVIFAWFLWRFAVFWDVVWCCVVLWVWSSNNYIIYGLFMYIHTMSRTLIGFLSPSLGLKFSDVPGGLAAISKVPAWSLENRESLTYNDTSWHIMTYNDISWHIMTYNDM